MRLSSSCEGGSLTAGVELLREDAIMVLLAGSTDVQAKGTHGISANERAVVWLADRQTDRRAEIETNLEGWAITR